MSRRIIVIPANGDPLYEMDRVNFNFPQLNFQLLGSTGALIEYVRPRGLRILNEQQSDAFIVMLVDEEGRNKRLPTNERASWLYGTGFHGAPIAGNAFIVAESLVMTEDGPDWVWGGLPVEVGVDEILSAIEWAKFAPYSEFMKD